MAPSPNHTNTGPASAVRHGWRNGRIDGQGFNHVRAVPVAIGPVAMGPVAIGPGSNGPVSMGPVSVGPATPAALADVPPCDGDHRGDHGRDRERAAHPDRSRPAGRVTLQLYGGSSAPNPTPLPDAWATCVSDAAGDCSFVVPDTQTTPVVPRR